jgi:hypothetical protein
MDNPNPYERHIRNHTNAELAREWVTRAAANDGDPGVIAGVYATLAVADALAIVHREIAYVAECLPGRDDT